MTTELTTAGLAEGTVDIDVLQPRPEGNEAFGARPEPDDPEVAADLGELAEVGALVESIGETDRLRERRAAVEERIAARERDAEAEATCAEKDAKARSEEYVQVRDALIEQLVSVDLVSECAKARRLAKEACARAREAGRPVRTPDSVAVVLKDRKEDTGRDAIITLQRELARDL